MAVLLVEVDVRELRQCCGAPGAAGGFQCTEEALRDGRLAQVSETGLVQDEGFVQFLLCLPGLELHLQ
ncbi:heterodisulfide reductase-related iron-sulfur binding cluster [Streptomyces sp. NPDC051098]|uniref:heterodisulfide reductase-related iron-sulfur binding cluster n=1 Tax=Streptomyces sp. NPDC051098 TaxID=3155411 RepID=UPI00341A542C